jgi:hypothetical protein
MQTQEFNMTVWLTLAKKELFENLCHNSCCAFEKVKYHSPQYSISVAFSVTFI